MKKFVDTRKILGFVHRVEKKKDYKKNANLIMRHLFEEVGEVSAELYKIESAHPSVCREAERRRVGEALVDIVCLSAYLADSLGVDLDSCFPSRMRQVARQYGVECPEAQVK